MAFFAKDFKNEIQDNYESIETLGTNFESMIVRILFEWTVNI